MLESPISAKKTKTAVESQIAKGKLEFGFRDIALKIRPFAVDPKRIPEIKRAILGNVGRSSFAEIILNIGKKIAAPKTIPPPYHINASSPLTPKFVLKNLIEIHAGITNKVPSNAFVTQSIMPPSKRN